MRSGLGVAAGAWKKILKPCLCCSTNAGMDALCRNVKVIVKFDGAEVISTNNLNEKAHQSHHTNEQQGRL